MNRIGENQRPFLRTKNVSWGVLDLSELDEMHFSEAEENRLALFSGDLLVCEGGDIGRTAIWAGVLPRCYYQNHLHRARLREDAAADSQFTLYWLWYAFEIGGVYFGRGNATTIPNLSQSKLCELLLPVPPLSEQSRIAGVLRVVQRTIEQQKRLIALTTELKKALLHKLFTQGLRSESQKQTEIGPVPESWEVLSVGQTGKVVTGCTPSTKRPEFYGGNYKLISPADLDSGIYIRSVRKKLTKEGFKECRGLPMDAVLVGCIGNIGKIGMTADVKSATNQQINAIVCSDAFNPHFIYYCLQFHRLRLERAASKVTIPILNKSNFECFKFAAPKKPIQDEIASVLAVLDTKLELHAANLAALTDLFRTLLHQLMTAQIRVHDLDLDGILSQAVRENSDKRPPGFQPPLVK